MREEWRGWYRLLRDTTLFAGLFWLFVWMLSQIALWMALPQGFILRIIIAVLALMLAHSARNDLLSHYFPNSSEASEPLVQFKVRFGEPERPADGPVVDSFPTRRPDESSRQRDTWRNHL